ncbi:hypothetical protein DZ860_03910 [Vibrio sinensis]|uniref:Uncharacterized protein n=1 Tax=Vibrio sinensis TaxID=2302434 RepID=A0A3A6QZK6_9VIBR|nr:hypothetical protein [Vibrio sinensis]RJX74287.1 hypothetical protein DZ860_03910 [Vibrio sinensis]
MKIIYFDTFSLLYSHQYVAANESVACAIEAHRFKPAQLFIQNVQPDLEAAKKLEASALKSGCLLFPTGNYYTKDLFIENNIFSEQSFAPEVDLSRRVKLDDSNSVRRLIAHAHLLEAEWFVCGDIGFEELLSAFPHRYLRSKFGEGVSAELLEKIDQLKDI